MQSTVRLRTVGALSLLFTYVFFLEYLPPFRRVRIPYDLEGFHYPLADYAFQSLRAGRFPEWDPTMYCGLSFVGNSQAALFYPPIWLVFAANFGRQVLSYQSLEDLVFAHIWLAFLLCYVWLRHQGLTALPGVLGASVFAYSGFMVAQLQHLGLIAGYTWMPLGLWGIDQAVRERRWRPLWKLAVASALCFLGGYPPAWFVFAVCMVSYAGWRWRAAFGTILALGASLLIAMIQLLPAWEATALKAPEIRYGAGIRDPVFYLSYLLPNYFDFAMHADPAAHPDGEYLYLGAPAFLGLFCLVWHRSWRGLIPSLTVAGVSLVAVTNPFGLVWEVIRHFSLLAQICRSWYFLAGLTLAAAPLTAFGLEACLKPARRPAPRWLVLLAIGLLAGWSVRELLAWLPGGSGFRAGWSSAVEPAITLALFAAAVYMLPGQRGVLRAGLIAVVLLSVGVEYKVFGTSKRFNANQGSAYRKYSSGSFPTIDDGAYRQLLAAPEYRVVTDVSGPFPQEFHHCALRTPQGFDPFLPTQYQKLMGRIAHFRSNWEIDIDPADEASLRLLGVRYFVTSESGPLYPRLSTNPSFRLLEPSQRFHKVFELKGAQPTYGWVPPDGARSVQRRAWSPEVRGFLVRSQTGGRFALVEQFFPGWQATVDGMPARIERWDEAFQAVWVPAGEHQVEFRFHSLGLRAGALVSLAALLGLGLVMRKK